MNGSPGRGQRLLVGLGCALLVLVGLSGCTPADPDRVQGYVEGEFVYVASPLVGAVEYLDVRRGDRVKAGDTLFTLDCTPEKAGRAEAQRRLVQARATWEDVRKGMRPSEIEALEAQLKQAEASLQFTQRELLREERMGRTGASSAESVDRARSARDQDRLRVARLKADLETARLGSRPDQVAAAEANVKALEAALAKAEWDLAQKRQNAPADGLVIDTLFREGEWVAGGRPVVVLLPPQYVKVRAFVPEPRIGAVRAGQSVSVHVDGVSDPYPGRVSFISPRAEYTPPVIYSRESRAKLVFMIEVRFDPEVATDLHPGQPVDVRLGG
ncbi:MAG: HlyD family efflux transporter periplasmic adaptor subunit [Gemmataceae bacterium]